MQNQREFVQATDLNFMERGRGRFIVWCWAHSCSPSATDSTFSNAKGKLTCEPLSSQRPSHQLLKAELPIIRRKRDTANRERRYPTSGGERSRGLQRRGPQGAQP